MTDSAPRVYTDADTFDRAITDLLNRFILRALRRSVRGVAGALSTDKGHVLALAPVESVRVRVVRQPIASKRARTTATRGQRSKPLPHHRGRRGAAR